MILVIVPQDGLGLTGNNQNKPEHFVLLGATGTVQDLLIVNSPAAAILVTPGDVTITNVNVDNGMSLHQIHTTNSP